MHLPQQLRVSPSLLFENGCGQEQCVSVSVCSLLRYLFINSINATSQLDFGISYLIPSLNIYGLPEGFMC